MVMKIYFIDMAWERRKNGSKQKSRSLILYLVIVMKRRKKRCPCSFCDLIRNFDIKNISEQGDIGGGCFCSQSKFWTRAHFLSKNKQFDNTSKIGNNIELQISRNVTTDLIIRSCCLISSTQT